MSEFLPTAPSAEAVFYRTYSRRKTDGTRESFQEAMTRCVAAIAKTGKFTSEEFALVHDQALKQHCFPSGRAFWVAGTEWAEKQENFSGWYNCTSSLVHDVEAFKLIMELAMMGSGTGAVLEQDVIESLPPVITKINIVNVLPTGRIAADKRSDQTKIYLSEEDASLVLVVGDSRQGWIDAYSALIEYATEKSEGDSIDLTIDLGHVRSAGERLKGFGGTANPIKLEEMFHKVAGLLNSAFGRQLTAIECCLLIDEASACVVAGNIRRSAGMRQFSQEDEEAANAKLGLYSQDENGNWRVNPEKEALRMANHTRCFHAIPDYQIIEDSVYQQFYSGEGAIQYVPEAIARSNADLLDTDDKKKEFIKRYVKDKEEGVAYLEELCEENRIPVDFKEIEHRMKRYGLNPCLTGDTRILTVHQGIKTFEELAETGEDILVWCVNKDTNEADVRMMRNPRITGYNEPILEIEFDSGLKVRATYNHNFFTLRRNKIQAKDLEVGQSVAAFAIHQHRDGHLRITRNNKTTDSVRQQFCHRVIGKFYGIDGEVIHHIDGDPTNNSPGNLTATNHLDHNKEHYAGRCRNGFYHGTPGPVAAGHIANHKVVAIKDAGIATVYNGTVDDFHNYVVVDPVAVGKSYVSGVLSANCGEILGADFHCNLAEIHLNTIDPTDLDAQDKAFAAGALQVGALLHHAFYHERYRYSRELDPIVGVSFTGLFDFFVHAFGAEWLEWMMRGRPNSVVGRKFSQKEKEFLTRWRDVVRLTVTNYCKKHGLKVPNRMTTVQPAGTKSLLTGASSGWHPPKAQRFIRRITFGKSDPLVSALRDWGYNVIPAQSAKDENGNLLDDIMDSRVEEVLVEIPTEVSWANKEGCDHFDLSKIPVEAQWWLYMQVQQHYTEHNTSATIEYREHEVEILSRLIHDSIKDGTGYISAALLARFDANETFPRLPFEPIDKETFDRHNGVAESYRSALPLIFEKDQVDFLEVLNRYDNPDYELKGAAGCDGEKCLAEAERDSDQVGQQI